MPSDRIGEDRELLDRVRRGKSIKDFETFRRREDGRDLHVALSLSPICNRAGSIIGATEIARDITERRRAEAVLRASEARFAAMFHQAVIGVALVDGGGRFVMANQYLFMANQYFCDILGRRESEVVGLRVLEVTHPEDRAANIKALKTLLGTVNLDEVPAEFAELVTRAVGDPIQVRFERAPDLLLCRVDPAQFQAALLNLAVNARDAMPEGGELVIETRNIDIDTMQAARLPEIAAGTYVGVTVSDTGSGVPPDILDRIFEPFFTTKTVGKGTGLGLAQVYGFVRRSGGTIRVDSEIGRGTAFQILLPAIGEAGSVSDLSSQPVAMPSGHQSVLVVEDG